MLLILREKKKTAKIIVPVHHDWKPHESLLHIASGGLLNRFANPELQKNNGRLHRELTRIHQATF